MEDNGNPCHRGVQGQNKLTSQRHPWCSTQRRWGAGSSWNSKITSGFEKLSIGLIRKGSSWLRDIIWSKGIKICGGGFIVGECFAGLKWISFNTVKTHQSSKGFYTSRLFTVLGVYYRICEKKKKLYNAFPEGAAQSLINFLKWHNSGGVCWIEDLCRLLFISP